MKRGLLKVGAILNIISAGILGLVFGTLTLLSNADISVESSESYDATITYELNEEAVSLSLSILILSTIIIFILSLCNMFLKVKIINIVISIIMVALSIMSGTAILIYGIELFICCMYWMFLVTPVLNCIGSILCLIGSCIQNGK